MRTIPTWLNCDLFLQLSAAGRWNSVQVLLHKNDVYRDMVEKRGVPDDAPMWLITEIWEKTDARVRIHELILLEEYAEAENAMVMRAEQDRARKLKSCVHEYASSPSVATQACVKCGHVKFC